MGKVERSEDGEKSRLLAAKLNQDALEGSWGSKSEVHPGLEVLGRQQ